MNIPLHALVYATDGPFGHLTCLIVNPVNGSVTHFVVNDRRILGHEHIVPISFITSTSEDSIRVRCDRAEISHQPGFFEYRFNRLDDMLPYREDHIYWPILPLEEIETDLSQGLPVEPLKASVTDLGIQRSMAVYTAAENEDGERTDSSYFGQVVLFAADSQSGDVTHLILRKACTSSQREAIVPISSIRKIETDKIQLKLTKQEVEDLPALRMRTSAATGH